MKQSLVEEILYILHVIAALVAWSIGWKVFSILLFIKAAWDLLCVFAFGLLEVLKELKDKDSK
jgi:hypothetical protein